MTKNLRQLYNLPDSVSPPLFLAPMAGFTNAPTRRIARTYGADLTFTEMVSAMGLIHQDSATLGLLKRCDGEDSVVAHLYGSDPAALAEATHIVTENGGFAGIDLNAGCPVRKVVRTGAGAALIRDCGLIHRILAAMRRKTTLPLTVKTRLGAHPGHPAIFEILRAAEDAGANALIVHARYTSQGHGGDTDLATLAQLKTVATIPVIGNGGVRSPFDAWRILAETDVDALMVARAAIGNPWIFNDISYALSSAEPPPVYDPTRGRPRRDLAEIRAVLLRHLDEEAAFLRYNGVDSIERRLVATFRCHLFRYLSGLKGSSFLRSRLNDMHTVAAMIKGVDACLERELRFRAKIK
jgi:tRNA-dihydrouridine synthase B